MGITAGHGISTLLATLARTVHYIAESFAHNSGSSPPLCMGSTDRLELLTYVYYNDVPAQRAIASSAGKLSAVSEHEPVHFLLQDSLLRLTFPFV